MTGFLGYERVLVITAVEAERAAVLAGLGLADARDDDLETGQPVVVKAAGVGPAAAAAVTAQLIAIAACGDRWFDAVICAGIAGGFAGRIELGDLAVATESIAADLGAAGPDGFQPLDELGFGTSRQEADPTLLRQLRLAMPAAIAGPVLTVSTVTGTAETTVAIEKRYPDAIAEAMEGFGVATAARGWLGVAFGEVRAVSNTVGPRDRASWRIPQALEALRGAFGALATFGG
jgi:futalosine hydrolase